VEFVYRTRSL